MVALPVVEAPATDYGAEESDMEAYRREGTRRAIELDNRGPLRFDASGELDSHILDSYSQHGFYILEGAVDEEELADIEADLINIVDRSPVTKDATVDRHGSPALGVGCEARNFSWVRPLSDPLGGTDAAHGRHPAKMAEPSVPDGAPEWVLQLILGSLQFSEACLRLYGHPKLLAVAAAINGPDFTPFNEAVWIKQPRLGGSVAWHQDGFTHWDNPDLDESTHGFNFMAQLYGCDASNGLWVVPGSHRVGRADIKAMVDDAGSDRLPNAVPLVCGPGDVAITNRQAIHGSFANTSPDVRVTINFGFHRRSSVLDVTSGGIHSPVTTYTDAYIAERSKMIAYGIDARRQRYPDEASFVYEPLAGQEEALRWSSTLLATHEPEVGASAPGSGVSAPGAGVSAPGAGVRDYNLKDLGI